MARGLSYSIFVAGSLLLGAGAQAADLSMRAAPVTPVAAAHNWSGCYAGVLVGGIRGSGQSIFEDPAEAPADVGLAQTNGISLGGISAGATLGCNYEFAGSWVVGLEDDLSWTNPTGTAALIPPLFVTTDTVQISQSWLDTLRGRVGYAWGDALAYATAGAAATGEAFQICGPAQGCAGSSATVGGWTAGAGVEYAFSDKMSVKLEFLHADFGSQFYGRVFPTTGHYNARNISLTDDTARVGLNLAF